MDALPDAFVGAAPAPFAVAMIHRPEMLIPTNRHVRRSVARDTFWAHHIELARVDQITIFISTHFMNEGALHRISLMHAGGFSATLPPP